MADDTIRIETIADRVYDRSQDAQTKSNREKYPENEYYWKKDYQGPREHYRWGSARVG